MSALLLEITRDLATFSALCAEQNRLEQSRAELRARDPLDVAAMERVEQEM